MNNADGIIELRDLRVRRAATRTAPTVESTGEAVIPAAGGDIVDLEAEPGSVLVLGEGNRVQIPE